MWNLGSDRNLGSERNWVAKGSGLSVGMGCEKGWGLRGLSVFFCLSFSPSYSCLVSPYRSLSLSLLLVL